MIKNIVYIYDQAYMSGGAAKIVIGEAQEMKKRGFRVFYFSAIGPICGELADSGIETICLDEKHIAFTKNPKALIKGIYNRNAYIQLKKLLSSLSSQETIVHIHGWTKALSSSVFLACSEMGVKTFVTLHEYFTICPNGGLYNYKQKRICSRKPGSLQCMLCNCDKRNYFHKMYRNVRQCIQTVVLKKAKPIPIYITKFSEKIISPFFPYRSDSYRITNHVENFRIENRIAAEENESYLYIGRLSEEKGLDLFCEAVTHLKKRAFVIGNGPQLDAFSKKYPQIDFVGWKTSEEMKPYVHKTRCLIVSSRWYETMGLTIVEMQQYGIPCIVPEQCAGSEYIDNNRTGLLYKIGDVESLMEAIHLTESDRLIQTISQNIHATLDADLFLLGNHCDALTGIYQEETGK